jgi:hypothetical protein
MGSDSRARDAPVLVIVRSCIIDPEAEILSEY